MTIDTETLAVALSIAGGGGLLGIVGKVWSVGRRVENAVPRVEFEAMRRELEQQIARKADEAALRDQVRLSVEAGDRLTRLEVRLEALTAKLDELGDGIKRLLERE